jgi:hypothetical protein
MAVNPLQPAMPYSINASNETSDNTRQRQEKNSSKEDSSNRSKHEKLKSVGNIDENSQDIPQDKLALELVSQIIDSHKVIELLAHRPKYKKSAKNCFLNRSSIEENSQIPDVKKINKAF